MNALRIIIKHHIVFMIKDTKKKIFEANSGIKSVIVFGKVFFVNDIKTTEEISRKLSHKFTTDENYINKEVKTFLDKTILFYIEIEDMCGKIVKEA